MPNYICVVCRAYECLYRKHYKHRAPHSTKSHDFQHCFYISCVLSAFFCCPLKGFQTIKRTFYSIGRATTSGIICPVLTDIHKSSLLAEFFFFFFFNSDLPAFPPLPQQQQQQQPLAWR